jgi:hypothetical protein
VFTSRVGRSAGASPGDAGDHALGLGLDLRRIALDERFRLQVTIETAALTGFRSRIDQLDEFAIKRLPAVSTSAFDKSTPIILSAELLGVAWLDDLLPPGHPRHNRAVPACLPACDRTR